MLNWCESTGKGLAQISLENELCWQSKKNVEKTRPIMECNAFINI